MIEFGRGFGDIECHSPKILTPNLAELYETPGSELTPDLHVRLVEVLGTPLGDPRPMPPIGMHGHAHYISCRIPATTYHSCFGCFLVKTYRQYLVFGSSLAEFCELVGEVGRLLRRRVFVIVSSLSATSSLDCVMSSC